MKGATKTSWDVLRLLTCGVVKSIIIRELKKTVPDSEVKWVLICWNDIMKNSCCTVFVQVWGSLLFGGCRWMREGCWWGCCLELLAAELWMSAHSSTSSAQTAAKVKRIFFTSFCLRGEKREGEGDFFPDFFASSLRVGWMYSRFIYFFCLPPHPHVVPPL